MRNRAKCKLCGDILESFHRHDFVTCKCGEISIDGGSDHYKCSARDFKNFLRVDDEGNEIVVKFEESVEEADKHQHIPEKPLSTKDDLIKMLDEMVHNIERLPPHALHTPITHADHCSLMMLLSAIFKAS